MPMLVSTASLTRAARAMTELELDDFATLLDTPSDEVEAWEQGVRTPPSIGVRLLTLILTVPEVCLHLLATPPELELATTAPTTAA